MNSQERLNLKRLVDETECEDNTENIRSLKHSAVILADVRKLEALKRSHATLRATDSAEFTELCRTECGFLFRSYTDIFNKLVADELNLAILIRMLNVLKKIEDSEVDQHEGSVLVGKHLKELYVDSALRLADKLDKQHADEKPAPPAEPLNISWTQYKRSKN